LPHLHFSTQLQGRRENSDIIIGHQEYSELKRYFLIPNSIDIADLLDDFFEAVTWEMEMRKCLYGAQVSNWGMVLWHCTVVVLITWKT